MSPPDHSTAMGNGVKALSRLHKHAPDHLLVPAHAAPIPLLTPPAAPRKEVEADADQGFAFVVRRPAAPRPLHPAAMEADEWPADSVCWWPRLVEEGKGAGGDWWRMRAAAFEPIAERSLSSFLQAQCTIKNAV